MTAKNDGFFNCTNICWIIGALVGLAVFMLLSGRFGMHWLIALVIAIVVLVGLAMWLQKMFCQTIEAETGSPIVQKVLEEEDSSAGQAAAVEPVETAPPMVAEPAPRPENAAATEAPLEAEAEVPAADSADVAEDEPEILSGPRGGAADDLKKISGVGPKLEKTLNEMGFYHFDQIAAWTPAQVAWVDSRLTFKGRIERDNWIAQARDLDLAKS